MKRCPNCARVAGLEATMCNGCGDEFLGNYLPKWMLIFLMLALLAFAAVLSLKPGFKAHPQRVALAQLGLGPSEDAIAEAEVRGAEQRGIIKRQRNLFAFNVDEVAWKRMSDADRSRLEDALVQRVYARELRNGEAVTVYDGARRRVVTVIRNGSSVAPES